MKPSPSTGKHFIVRGGSLNAYDATPVTCLVEAASHPFRSVLTIASPVGEASTRNITDKISPPRGFNLFLSSRTQEQSTHVSTRLLTPSVRSSSARNPPNHRGDTRIGENGPNRSLPRPLRVYPRRVITTSGDQHTDPRLPPESDVVWLAYRG